MEFKNVELAEYKRYDEYYKQCMIACSETSFLSVWSRSFSYGLKQCFAKEFYWHVMPWEGEQVWLPPVGDWDSTQWEQVLTECVPTGTVFCFVPEYLLKKWQPFEDKIEVEEMRSEWDYVYSIDNQVESKGKSYKAWRNMIGRFEREYDYTLSEINVSDIDEIKEFQSWWMKSNEGSAKMTEELVKENKTILYILEHLGELPNWVGGVVRVDGKVVAYAILERIDENIVSYHVQKTNKDYIGLSQFLTYQLLKNILADCSVLNAWGDADLDGLRKNKMNENPIVLYKKYKVLWKG